MSIFHESTELIEMAIKGLFDSGIDGEKFFRKFGLNKSEAVSDNKDFYKQWVTKSLEERVYFLNALVEFSEDPDLGLHAGERFKFGNLVEYLILSSNTLLEGLETAGRYKRVLSDFLQTNAGLHNKSCYISIGMLDHRLIQEAILVHLFRFLRFATDNKFNAHKVCFMHEKPDNIAEHERIFGCPVEFSASSNRIYFSPDILKLKPSLANAELNTNLKIIVENKLSGIEEKTNLSKTKLTIYELLGNTNVTLEVVADRLCIEPTKLKYQLISQGTSFTNLLNERRSKSAIYLLTKTHNSIDSIVQSLGFSETSSFYRAFKRWHGITPIQYREAYLKGLSKRLY